MGKALEHSVGGVVQNLVAEEALGRSVAVRVQESLKEEQELGESMEKMVPV